MLGWRDTPIDANAIGRIARASQPYIEQVFVRHAPGMDQDSLERKLYVIRKRAEAEVRNSEIHDRDFFYIPSLSSRTIVYKGLLLAPQIREVFGDLTPDDFEVPLVVFHQRYSTNTFPTWARAEPFRVLCHNGEINTLQGNLAPLSSLLREMISAARDRYEVACRCYPQ